MIKPANIPRRHHYVPMLLLRRFANQGSGKKLRTNVLDKLDDRTFTPPIDKIMVEGDFDIAEMGEVDLDFEASHGRIEANAAPHLAATVAKRSLSLLTAEARLNIVTFVTLQFMRAPERRVQFAEFSAAIDERVQHLVKRGAKPPLKSPGDNPKNAALLMTMRRLPEFAKHFWLKDMILLGAAEGTEFLLGDSPVVLHNDEDFGPYGNLGIGVPGIQITLPISYDLAIAFWCPSIRGKMRESVDRMDKAIELSKVAVLTPSAAKGMRVWLKDAEDPRNRLMEFLESSSGSSPFPSTAQNMEHLNALQVMTASRFVISRSGDFSFARRVLSDTKKKARIRGLRFD